MPIEDEGHGSRAHVGSRCRKGARATERRKGYCPSASDASITYLVQDRKSRSIGRLFLLPVSLNCRKQAIALIDLRRSALQDKKAHWSGARRMGERETNRTYDAELVALLAGSSADREVSILSRNCCNRS
jgi:hypothetical protein